MLFLYLVFLLFFVATRAAVIFQDCGRRGGDVVDDLPPDERRPDIGEGSAYDLRTVNIQGCEMRLPCFVTLGDRIPVNLKFYADFESRQLDQDVTIQINFVHARTPVTPESCETASCPVRTDAETSFTSVMTVPTDMALNQRGYLQWRVYNEKGRRVLCYQVMVQTQNFVQKLLRRHLAAFDARIDRLGLLFSRDTINARFNSTVSLPKPQNTITPS